MLLVVLFACATHWFAGLLYMVPVFILGGGVMWQRHRDKELVDVVERIADEHVPFTDEPELSS